VEFATCARACRNGWLSEPPREAPRLPQRIERASFELSSSITGNEELREFLRKWRRNTAREKGIAAFVVMHDTALDALCACQPKTLHELRQISGMGEKKCELYGQEILHALERFRQGERASQEWHARPSNPSQETLELLLKGRTFEEIAQIRGRKVSSVVALVADLIERGATRFQDAWVEAEKREKIREAAEPKGLDRIPSPLCTVSSTHERAGVPILHAPAGTRRHALSTAWKWSRQGRERRRRSQCSGDCGLAAGRRAGSTGRGGKD